MRVLLLLESYREDDRGRLIYHLCQRWQPMRELTLASVAFGEGGPLQDRLGEIGVGTKVLPPEVVANARALRAEGTRLLQRQDRPDMIHSHLDWPALGARFLHDGNEFVPLACTIYASRDQGKVSPFSAAWSALRERRTRKDVDAFVFTSQALLRDFQARKIDHQKCHLIPLGVDAVQSFPLSESKRAHYRALLGVEADTPVLLQSCRLCESSGQRDLVEAMPAILERHPGARLFLIGDGPLRGQLEQRIRELGLEGRIRLIGQISEIQTRLYSAADVVIHPVPRSTFPLDVMESQATGTPVVAANGGALPEVVRDQETGLLFPPGDVSALTEALDRLLSDRELRESIGEAARDYMLGSFEMGQTADAYIALWKQLAPDALWKATDSVPIEDLQELKEETEEEN